MKKPAFVLSILLFSAAYSHASEPIVEQRSQDQRYQVRYVQSLDGEPPYLVLLDTEQKRAKRLQPGLSRWQGVGAESELSVEAQAFSLDSEVVAMRIDGTDLRLPVRGRPESISEQIQDSFESARSVSYQDPETEENQALTSEMLGKILEARKQETAAEEVRDGGE